MRYQALRDFYNIYFFGGILLYKVKANNKVLEVGCGSNSLIVKSGLIHKIDNTGVDIFKPYIDSHNAQGLYEKCICGDITDMRFGVDEFDVVVCMDVIEHIEKEKGGALLERMRLWAKKVIVTTPNGYSSNESKCDNNDKMAHLCGWTVSELNNLGYTVRGLSGWKGLRIENAQLKYTNPYLFWAGVSLLSETFVYYNPKHAYHLLATVG
jgi:SAM-dependent methyltransferase